MRQSPTTTNAHTTSSSWFTPGKSASTKPAPPSNEDRLASVRGQHAALERRRIALRSKIDAAIAEAQQYGRLGQMTLATDALARKHVHEREYKTVAAMLTSLEQSLSAVEQATLTATMADSFRESAAVLSSVRASVDVADVERSMVDMRMHAGEMEQATALMTQPLFAYDVDDDDDVGVESRAALDAELTTLLAAGTLTAAPPPTFPSVPQTVPTAAAKSTKTTRQLEAELGL